MIAVKKIVLSLCLILLGASVLSGCTKDEFLDQYNNIVQSAGCRICNRWVDCDTDNGSNRNPADPISSEMVLGAVSDYAAVHCGYVGHHCAV